MKSWLKLFAGILLGAWIASAGLAQTQPVVSVSITDIDVGAALTDVSSIKPLTFQKGTDFGTATLGGTATRGSTFPNESYGAVGNTLLLGAFAVGTAPSGGFTYTYFVNGVSIGQPGTNPSYDASAVVSWTPPQPGAYFITVTASDGSNTATSLPVRYFATGTQIIGPTPNTLVPNGSSVVIQAVAEPQPLANGQNAFVKRMDFYADGGLIGSAGTFPYSIIYTPPTLPSTHTIEARAFDNNGNQISANGAATQTLTMVTAIGTPPTCAISSPSNNAAIAIPTVSTTNITVAVDAHSLAGNINKVELYINGVLFGTNSAFPYTFTWHPTIVGTYSLVGLAYDDKGNVVASTTSTTASITPAPTTVVIAAPPTVSMVTPTNGGTVTGGSPTQLTATATDPDPTHPVVSVQFFVDSNFVGQSTSPDVDANNKPTNNYTVTATLTQKTDSNGNPVNSTVSALATDSVGLSGGAPGVSVSVTVGGTGTTKVIGQPPTVRITGPTGGTTFAVNQPVRLTADAKDTDGNIVSVQFFVNKQAVGSPVTAYPYASTWTPTSLGTYTITATTVDNDGNNVTSDPVTVTVNDPNPNAPTVSIANPAGDTGILVGTTLSILASATQVTNNNSIGVITGVQFFINGQPFGALVTTYPFAVNWTPATPGSYQLTAAATNQSGIQTMSSTRVVTVTGGAPPTITLAGPSTALVNRTQTLTATANSSTSFVANVQFLVNGVALGSATSTYPYTANWTPSTVGTYTLTARATDNQGNQTLSAPVIVSVTGGTPPTVAITGPANNASVLVGVTQTLTATANSPSGTIASVQFIVNGVPISPSSFGFPYTAKWTPFSVNLTGSYTIVARATDDVGNVVDSAPISVKAVANSAGLPTVALTSTPTGTNVTVNTPVFFSAAAQDPDGQVIAVDFYVNGQLIGSKAAAPYFVEWVPTSPDTYSLTAVVTDDGGNRVTSAPSTVTATNPVGAVPVAGIVFNSPAVDVPSGSTPPPAVSPFTPVPVDFGSKLIVSAYEITAGAPIASAQIYANGTLISTQTKSPFFTTYQLNTLSNVVLIALLTDTAGNSVYSDPIIINTVASSGAAIANVNLISPLNGATYTAGAPILFQATHDRGTANPPKIDFYLDGFQFSTVTLTPGPAAKTAQYIFGITDPGTYVVNAVARFGTGTTVSAPATIVVKPNKAPTVNIVSPADSSTYGIGAGLTITANASDSDGTIESVQFFANSSSISTKNTSPYTAAWNPGAAGTFVLTALATDDGGNQTLSTPVTVKIVANVPPTVSIATPTTGTTVVAGTPISLLATAADVDGVVSSVRFLAGGSSIGTVTAAPFGLTWLPAVGGVYSVVAEATDNSGNVTVSAPVTITVQTNKPPTVAISSPAPGASAVAGNVVNLAASAADSDGIVSSVRFIVNGNIVGTATGSPFNVSWTPNSAGNYAITAQATDNGGSVTNSATFNLKVFANLPPTVSISGPATGTTVTADNPVILTALATDADGTVASVRFLANGNTVGTALAAPFAVTWKPSAGGSYGIVAEAIDNSGNVSDSSPINVKVIGNQPPTVAITKPATNTTVVVGVPITFAAIATDIDGAVTSVRFLANGNPIGTVTTSPFTLSWTPLISGTYAIVAEATDNSGNITDSTPVSVQVSTNQPPTVAVTTPSSGTVVRTGTPTTLSATAADADGTVASVQFFANGISLGAPITSPPYRATWTPGADGIYRLTAVAVDNGGASTTSAFVAVMSISPTSPSLDSVSTGTYQGATESGNFAVISVGGNVAAFIGFSKTPGIVKTYFFPAMPVDSSGGFATSDAGGHVLISGSTSDTGATGTFNNGQLTFIGVNAAFFPAANPVATGYYTGNVTGSATSAIAAIVGADGSITLYASDTGFQTAGAAKVDSTGAFAITAVDGTRVTGKVDPSTGFMSGSLGGKAFLASSGSGISFSDGALTNLSTRTQVGAGGNILIAGFVVGGSAPKQLLIRAVGPGLTRFGVDGVLADPQLKIFSGNTLVGSNDNWGGDPAIVNASAQVGAFPLAANSLDAVVLAPLSPGTYSAQVSGPGTTTGIVLIELYDEDAVPPFSTQKLINVSSRGLVTPGQGALIAGFVVSGTTPKKLLIRGVGPTLAPAPFKVQGALIDPLLRIVRSDGLIVRENDDWATGNDIGLIASASTKAGAFPLAAGGKDAAILINLPPGTYSAEVIGNNNSTGVALVEVYEVP